MMLVITASELSCIFYELAPSNASAKDSIAEVLIKRFASMNIFHTQADRKAPYIMVDELTGWFYLKANGNV
jgi:hypothetical protein